MTLRAFVANGFAYTLSAIQTPRPQRSGTSHVNTVGDRASWILEADTFSGASAMLHFAEKVAHRFRRAGVDVLRCGPIDRPGDVR